MARIPIITSNLDGGTAVNLPRTTPQQFGAGIAAQVQDAGQDIAQLALQRRRDDQRTLAGTRLAQLAVTGAQTVAERRQNAAAGAAGHSEAVLASFDQAAATVLDGIDDPEVANWTQRQIAEERARLTINESGWEAGKRAEKLVLDFSEGDSLERTQLYANPSVDGLTAALNRRKGVIDGLSGIDANAKQKLWIETREGLTLQMVQGIAERDPFEGRKLLESGALAGLIDPNKLQPVRGRIDAEINQAINEARAEAHRREAEAKAAAKERRQRIEQQIRDANDYLRDGGTLTRAQIGALVNDANMIGAPALAAATLRLGIKSVVNTELRGRPAVEIEAIVNGLSAEINKAGANAPSVLLLQREAALDKLAKVRSAVNSNPLSFAVQEGVLPDLTPLDLGNPKALSARYQEALAVQRRYGGPLVIATATETEQLKGAMAGDAKRATATIMALRNLPAPAVRALARQISPDEPITAHLISLGTLPGDAGRQVVNNVKIGEEILKANKKIIDSSLAELQLADTLGGALSDRPQLQAVVRPVADAIYATRAQTNGWTEFDPKRYAQAVNDALGAYRGLDGQQRGGIGTDLRGNQTLLPGGVSQDEFTAAIEALDDAALARNPNNVPQDARGKPIPAAKLKQARLVAVGDGRYQAMVDGRIVLASGGGAFQLTVRPRVRP